MKLSRRALGTVSGFSVLLLVASCARNDVDPSLVDSDLFSERRSPSFGKEKLSFSEWCARWELNCPEQPSKLDEDGSEPTLESKETLQWNAITRLVDKLIVSGSEFAIDDTELTSGKTRLLMTQIGVQEAYGDVLETLQRSGLKKFIIDSQGSIRFEARTYTNGQAGTVRGRSGMKWTFGNRGEVAVGEAGTYLFSGLQFTAANSFESDVFGQLGYNDADKTTWSGSNLAVTHVPDGFFIRDIPVRWEKFSEVSRVPLLRSVTELRNLALAQGRSLRLNAAFFNTAAEQMPLFVEDPKILPAITRLTDAFGLMEIKSPTQTSALAQMNLERANSVSCRIEMSGTPAIDLTLDKRFGIQNAYTNEKLNAQIDLYGINIKARLGIPISFNLKRVDVEPARIVIKGVPVIGEISIPWPDDKKKFDKELKKFECTERI